MEMHLLGQMSNPDNDRIPGWLIISGLLLAAAILGYLNYQYAKRNAAPFRIEASTTLDPATTLDTLHTQFARDGWQLGYRSDARLIMQRDRSASLGSTAAIGCLSVWLALLHVLTSSGTITLEILVSKAPHGSTIIANGSRSGGNVLNYTAHWLRELPKS